MAREILFKAKRIDNGEWVMGGSIIQFLDDGVRSFYVPQFNEKCICEHDEVTDDILSFSNCRFYKVDGNTLCQYTGLTDKNGNKIWENDIVKCYCIDIANREYEFASNVFWDDCMWMLHETECCDNMLHHFDMSKNWMSHIPEIEVIGNIFDNPELLEVVGNER